MQAVILAAGMGKRLKELTQNNTKCMVKVNGTTLIERLLRQLEQCHLSKIVIVIGHEGRRLREFIDTLDIKTQIIYINNPIYKKTNNIYSLALAKDYLCAEDTLLFESDLIVEDSMIEGLLSDPRETLALVDKFESWMDGTCLELDEEDCIVNFIPGKLLDYSVKENYYKTVNIYKFSRHFSENVYVPFLGAYEKAMGENEYYESVIKIIAMLGTKEIKAKRLENQVWYEIDDIQDLDIAETLFADSDTSKYDKIMARYGGYWRYPKMLDFCYLVNPYFPSVRMVKEMEANFTTLLTNYPSGMVVNSLLAGKNFGVRKEHIVVGNGAAELIKVLLEDEKDWGRLGMIRPTFEEYAHRYEEDRCVVFIPDNENFFYTQKDIMDYYGERDIDTLLLINPDNPSGNYIPSTGVHELIEWAKRKEISLIVDESFVDFAEEKDGMSHSIITEDVLQLYRKLYVVKSISKSYGVPGLRLGVLASCDEELIGRLKKEVAIWNINSFGEFFMQIYEKHKSEYESSLERIKESRKKLMEWLEEVPYLRAIPSQANYIMCEVEDRMDSRWLVEQLLKKGMLVKDLRSKISNGKQYIRIAVRDEEDNGRLVRALRECQIKG